MEMQIVDSHSYRWVPVASILQKCGMKCPSKFRGQADKWDKDESPTYSETKQRHENAVQ